MNKPLVSPRTRSASSAAFLGLLMCFLFVVRGAARAEAAPTSTPEEERLIKAGLESREKGDDEAALSSFRKAYELSKGARPLAQVALAEQALGRWVDAEAHLGTAISRPDEPWIARNKPLLEQALSEIQGHLGSLELSGGVAGAEVRLNGESVGSLPFKTPIRVAAGGVPLEVRAPGYLPVARTVIIPTRGLARESVVLVAAGPAIPTRSPTPMTNDVSITTVGSEGTRAAPSGTWSTRKRVALVLGGAATIGLGIGTTFLFIRDSRAKDYNNPTVACSTADANPSETCKSLKSREQSALLGGVVGLIGGVVLGGAATYLFLTDHTSDESSVALGQGAFVFRCFPTAGAGITCAGTF